MHKLILGPIEGPDLSASEVAELIESRQPLVPLEPEGEMVESPEPTDLLGLTEEREGAILRFGAVDVSHAVKNGHIHEALNSRSTADAELDLALTAGQPIDYLSVVSFGHARGSQETVRFTGSVLEARTTAGAIRLNAETAPRAERAADGLLGDAERDRAGGDAPRGQ